MKMRLPKSFYNLISYVGAVIAIVATFMFVFLYTLSSLSTLDKAYVGIVIFMVIPAFIILGLLLIPIGMLRKQRQEKKSGKEMVKDFPVLDLNNPRHRTGAIIFAVGSVVFLFLSALGSYEAYHYTESVTFCGTLCHSIMIPEYTAYHNSPHARVTCAECHVGEGANWYVKSKLSGLKQVYHTLANDYPRPIPTPIENLRPARETCEECHWPQKIYGKQQRIEYYYLSDESNTKWEIDMLMNTGGGNPSLGQRTGIHWHINPDVRIEYITTDENRESIPRVVLINLATGDTTVYNNTYEPLDEENAEFVETRVMDCIDCHNRPSHIYNDPATFVNIAIASGEIDVKLPEVKRVAVEACVEEYTTMDSAMVGIKDYMSNYYEENYPELMQSINKGRLWTSVAGIQKAYSKNIFPEMKVSWEKYPNHIGHMTSMGCFRCHDGLHESEDGKVISKSCDNCHSITAEGPEGDITFASSQESLEFRHPVDIDEAWREMNCSECHSSLPL